VNEIEVSVIIVNWNSREVLLGCLGSLAAHPPAPEWEAIVVDNGSADGSVAAVRDTYPEVRVIANPDNRGLPAANNQGIAAAAGNTLLICNPDVIFQPGAAAALVELLGRHERAGMVIPRLLYPDGEVQTSAGDLPTLGEALRGRQAQRRIVGGGRHGGGNGAGEGGAGGGDGSSGGGARRGGAGGGGGGAGGAGAGAPAGFWWDGWAHDSERVIGRGHEAAYVVRRAAVDEVGLQDEGFRLDWEGIDWTARFRDAGWEVWLCPAASVVHLGGASIRQVPFRWVVSSHRGMYRYFAKRRPAYWRPVLALAIGTRAVVKLAATAGGMAMYERGHRRPARGA
jgi:GT2 family glycosyltransferase